MCFCRVKLSAVPPFRNMNAYGVNSQPWMGRSVRNDIAKTMSVGDPSASLHSSPCCTAELMEEVYDTKKSPV